VRDAFRAAPDRSLLVRRPADDFACRESALGEAALRPSRFNACVEARDRLAVDFARAGAP
jgi:hypothetical protein